MGYTGYCHTTKQEALKQEFSCATVLYQKMIKSIAYTAYKNKDDESIYGAVSIVENRGNKEVFIKTMGCSMHPFYYDAPKQMLDLLTHQSGEDFNNWVNCCKKNALKEKIKIGDIVEFTQPLEFKSGAKLTRFTKDERKNIFVNNGRCYKIPNYNDMNFIIIQG